MFFKIALFIMLSLIILLEKFEFPQSCKVIQSYLQWRSHFNSLTSCKVKISAQLSRFNYILQRALTITRISPSGMSVLLLVNFYPKVEIETSESYYSSFFSKQAQTPGVSLFYSTRNQRYLTPHKKLLRNVWSN